MKDPYFCKLKETIYHITTKKSINVSQYLAIKAVPECRIEPATALVDFIRLRPIFHAPGEV